MYNINRLKLPNNWLQIVDWTILLKYLQFFKIVHIFRK